MFFLCELCEFSLLAQRLKAFHRRGRRVFCEVAEGGMFFFASSAKFSACSAVKSFDRIDRLLSCEIGEGGMFFFANSANFLCVLSG